MQVQDVRGNSIDVRRAPQRIVSLVPSVTEALFTFGAGERVVGITDYCIHPADGVASKTKVGGTKNPRVEQILSLEPDLVIANVEENQKRVIETLQARGVPVLVMFPRTVRGAINELRALAQLIGATNTDEIISPMEQALTAVPFLTSKPRVFVAIWRDPWMTVNGETFISDLIETCGGENIFRDRTRRFPLAADLGCARSQLPSESSRGADQRGESATARVVQGQDTRYPRVSLEQVAAHNPKVILLPDEPYRFTDRDVVELRGVFPDARVHLVDGTLVAWHGVRIKRALDEISKILGTA